MGGRRGINCAHSPHVSRLLRISASRNCRTERAGGFGIQRIRAWAGARTWRAPALRRRPVARVGWQAFWPREATWFADGKWPARGPEHTLASSRPPTPKFSTKAARLTKAGSQLPTCQDRKLIELLNPYSTSKPNQLRGLLSE